MCLPITNYDWTIETIKEIYSPSNEEANNHRLTNTEHKDLDRFLVDDYIANQVTLWINNIMS